MRYSFSKRGLVEMSTLQIQTVLFKNEKWAIVRSLESIKIALAVANSMGTKFSEAKVCYGDASPERLFSDEEIFEFNRKYKNFFSVEYTPILQFSIFK